SKSLFWLRLRVPSHPWPAPKSIQTVLFLPRQSDSKSGGRKAVKVRLLSPAPKLEKDSRRRRSAPLEFLVRETLIANLLPPFSLLLIARGVRSSSTKEHRGHR